MSGRKRKTLVFLLVLCLLPAGLVRPAGAAGTLTLPANLKTVPAEMFCGDQSISKVVLPDGLTGIGSRAFAGSSLKDITIPATAASIADDAFEGCVADTLRITAATVKTIRERMFNQCGWFSTLVIGDGAASIGTEAFAGAPLTDITIPSSVTEIADDAFAGCTGATLHVTKGSQSTVISEALFSGRQEFSSAVIGYGVTKIGPNAFAGSALTEVTISATVTSIADDAFEGCQLEAIHVSKGSYAYSWMRNKGYLREYRALLVGQTKFLRAGDVGFVVQTAMRNKKDVTDYMAPALGETSGPEGLYGPAGSDFNITCKYDLSYSALRAAIRTAFADTRDQDVSVFFIATHGDNAGDGDLEMAFNGNPGNWNQIWTFSESQFVPFSTLASWLKTYVKGKVFVILESCGAGSSIKPADPEGNGAKGGAEPEARAKYDPKAFTAKAVEAFAEADPGLADVRPGVPETGLRKNSTGDLMHEKFYVLAAAAHHEESYGPGSDTYNFFTKWLTEGIGSRASSPADTNGDELLTLQEMYSYVSEVGDNYISTHYVKPNGEPYPDQHVQCWPANSTVPLLKLK